MDPKIKRQKICDEEEEEYSAKKLRQLKKQINEDNINKQRIYAYTLVDKDFRKVGIFNELQRPITLSYFYGDSIEEFEERKLKLMIYICNKGICCRCKPQEDLNKIKDDIILNLNKNEYIEFLYKINYLGEIEGAYYNHNLVNTEIITYRKKINN